MLWRCQKHTAGDGGISTALEPIRAALTLRNSGVDLVTLVNINYPCAQDAGMLHNLCTWLAHIPFKVNTNQARPFA